MPRSMREIPRARFARFMNAFSISPPLGVFRGLVPACFLTHVAFASVSKAAVFVFAVFLLFLPLIVLVLFLLFAAPFGLVFLVRFPPSAFLLHVVHVLYRAARMSSSPAAIPTQCDRHPYLF